MSVTYCPVSEVYKAIFKIISPSGVNKEAAAKSLAYVESELKPAKDQLTKTLLEAVFTQVVFFYVILLIVLLVCILWCCWVTNMNSTTTFCIMFAVVIITVILLAIVSFYVIDKVTSTVDSLLSTVTRADLTAEEAKIKAVVNSAAQVYLDAVLTP